MEFSGKNSNAVRTAIASHFHSSTGSSRPDENESLHSLFIGLQQSHEVATAKELARCSDARDRRKTFVEDPRPHDGLLRRKAIGTWENEGGAPLRAAERPNRLISQTD